MRKEKHSYIVTYEEDSGRAKVDIYTYSKEDAKKLCYKWFKPIFIYDIEQFKK